MGGETILIIDDDRHVVRLARLYLSNNGYDVRVVRDHREALRRIDDLRPDLVILDLTAPEIDGLEACGKIHQGMGVPLIVVSSRNAEADRIATLERGADDFIAKPYNPKELVARVKAVLRRTQAPPRPQRVIRFGDLALDTSRREVVFAGEMMRLRPKEYAVLEVLASQPGITVTREQLLNAVWGSDFLGDDRTLTVHIAWLRSKLADLGVAIEAVRGVGYRLKSNWLEGPLQQQRPGHKSQS